MRPGITKLLEACMWVAALIGGFTFYGVTVSIRKHGLHPVDIKAGILSLVLCVPAVVFVLKKGADANAPASTKRHLPENSDSVSRYKEILKSWSGNEVKPIVVAAFIVAAAIVLAVLINSYYSPYSQCVRDVARGLNPFDYVSTDEMKSEASMICAHNLGSR